MNYDIETLLRPKSIAIIGASAKTGKIGNALVRNLKQSSAKIFPINPNEESIEGLQCFKSIAEIKEEIELAIIPLPAEKACEEAKKASEKGVPFLIIPSAGFSEVGDDGRRLEKEMVDYVKARGTRILGPNTLGICSPLSGIDTMIIPIEKSPRPKRGKLCMISQSGSVQVSMLEKAASVGIGVSYSIGLGNRSDISEIDLLQFFENDQDTECIAIYLESFHDGKQFLEISNRISPIKPMIAIKAGSTDAGVRAASSHTGALSRGSGAIVDGALRQSGIIRANDDEELIDYAMALMMMPVAKGNRVAYVGSAGGIGVMASDYVEGSIIEPKLEMAKLSETTRKSLRQILYEFSPVNNPVDLTASSSPSQYDDSVRLVLKDPNVDLLILSIDMQPPMMNEEVFKRIPSWIDVGKPIVGTSTGGEMAIKTVSKMNSLGIPSYTSLSRCVKAAKTLYKYGLFKERPIENR